MEQKFSNNSLDLETLREFCRREGETVIYRRGDQLEREGDPARWLAFVTEGCFKYVTHGLSDDREHITWFLTSSSFTNRENPLIQNMADDPEHDIFRLAKTITTGFSPVQSDSIENVTLRSSRIQSMKW